MSAGGTVASLPRTSLEVPVLVRRLLSFAALTGPRAIVVAPRGHAALCALMVAGAVEAGGVAAPRASGPPNGASFPELPPFSWRAVRGADHYEFQIAADRSFS